MRYRDWLWLLWPPAWFTIFTGSKDFSSSAVLGSPTLNAAGLHVWRMRLAHWVCARRRARMRKRLPAALAQQWDDTGCVRIDDFLSPGHWATLCDELSHAALPMAEMVQPPALTRRANLDIHTCRDRCPALLPVLSDRRLIALLHYAAGYPGRPVVSLQCVHSHWLDAPGCEDPQTEWHADTFHSTAKAWLFLHPVGAADGPFGYRAGSHALTAGRLQWEQQASVVAARHPNRMHAHGSFRACEADLAAMGYGDALVADVPGNTLIVADTGGFHRRMPSPGPTVRVEIYFSLRRNPFLAGLFPALLDWPVVRDRWAGWVFSWYQRQYRRGKPTWTPKETAGLNDAEKQVLCQGTSLKSLP
jgi:hypothetical protein